MNRLEPGTWYSVRVARWLAEFGVTACRGCEGTTRHSRAHVDDDQPDLIHCAVGGFTRRSLFTWAHELGHCRGTRAMRGPGVTACESEYHATLFAVWLFERDRIPVPQAEVDAYRSYVGRKALGRVRAGRPVPADLLHWARVAVPA